jgi:hypothetical protein
VVDRGSIVATEDTTAVYYFVANLSLKNANWNWEPVVARSKALFGSPHRLPVALLVSLADADELYAACIAEAAEIDRKEATREFKHLQSADLLIPVSREIKLRARGRPAQFMERRDDYAWSALQALAERFRQPEAK